VACLIRVPTEVLKQRVQAGIESNVTLAAKNILKTSNIFGFYQGMFLVFQKYFLIFYPSYPTILKGFWITLLREVPFSFIQFPLYERLKVIMLNIENVIYIFNISMHLFNLQIAYSCQ
jgi:solute carrier family 25 S-adenosylmethionine transporter 26